MVFSQKMKVKLPYDLAIPFLGIYPTKNKSTNLKRHIHLNFHISIIFNSQDMGATQMSINREMDKEDVVCVYIYIYTMEYHSAMKRMKICHLQQHEWTWRALC